MPGREVAGHQLNSHRAVYHRASGAAARALLKAGNQECFRERLRAPAGCSETRCLRASPSALGIVARRRQLALTIDRHGRLTQRSHCCDPCSPRRCAARCGSLLHLSSLTFAAMRNAMRRGCVGIALTALLLVVARTNGLVPEGGSKNIVFIAADEHAARRRPVRVGRRATSCEVQRRVDAERSCAAVAAAPLATR